MKLIEKECLTCNKKFYRYPSQAIEGRAKYCSRACNARSRTGKLHGCWKGDKVGYGALHTWIQHKLGKPRKCEDCKSITALRYEWANISGKYSRDLSDWKRLCKSCHIKFDNSINKGWKTKHENSNQRKRPQ